MLRSHRFLPLVTWLFAGCQGISAPSLHGTLLEPPMDTPDFILQSVNGPVASTSFRGNLVVLTFGYTSCPDVCPATLARLARTLDLLGPQADEVQVLMITVDPERDTTERLARYTRAFDERFIGLSGTPGEIAAVAADFGVFYDRVEGSSANDYMVDHSATTFVLNREGDTWLLWPFDTSPDEMASDLRQLIRAS
ncbi:MAG: SCO family protein [Bacteroidetes bacterium]|nr:hypothetical protein AWN76_001605 [Rhodothermaceae bacterium RA]RMH54627.1 MAG: SCO family protein [Bacteroidota bacterium]